MRIKSEVKNYKASEFLQAQAEMSLHHVFIPLRRRKVEIPQKEERTTNEKCLTSQVEHERDEKKTNIG